MAQVAALLENEAAATIGAHARHVAADNGRRLHNGGGGAAVVALPRTVRGLYSLLVLLQHPGNGVCAGEHGMSAVPSHIGAPDALEVLHQ